MTIKSSGSLKMSEINAELGRTNTATNLGLSALRTLAGKPTGTIKFSDFYGKTHEVIATLSASNSIVLEAYFTAADWASSVPKRVIIPAGVEIGATNINYAIATSYTANGQAGNFAGTLTLENRGTISGMGGAANSGVGGTAIMPQFLGRDGNKLIIQNYGTIRAGGGGGGRGGNGGNGSYVSTREPASGFSYQFNTAPYTVWRYGSGSFDGIYWQSSNPIAAMTSSSQTSVVIGGWTYLRGTQQNPGSQPNLYSIARQQTSSTTGGAGGNGAVGQGYGQAAGTGANGAAGGTNAGTGGKGGNGGGWGASGATGATGTNGNVSNGAAGAAGGLAGFYINTSSVVTLTNSGTVLGRLG